MERLVMDRLEQQKRHFRNSCRRSGVATSRSAPVYRPRTGAFLLSIAAWAAIITGIWLIARWL